MRGWDVMRQGDSGDQDRVSSHDSRIGALAHVMVMESGVPHKQMYWVAGPPGPAIHTNRDLYLHFLRLGRQAKAASWSLSAFLRGLWKVSVPLRERPALEPDEVAAMFSAAATTSPPPFDPSWTTADFTLAGTAPAGPADWERVVLSQIADLEDFTTFPPGGLARFGVSAPRPPGTGSRATPQRWLNFDPAAYLECAVAGSLGGWHPADGSRVPLPGPVALPPSPIRELGPLDWAALCRLAACGQLYE